MKKTTQLKKMIQSSELEFLMEAHNGLSAKVAEEAGFKGIWASGLSISAALGVRDNNEASWTQVLEVAEFMSDATRIPILLDGDTGYGNFNTMRRVVRKLEQRNIAGVCIEDKIFPKTNSFIKGTSQPLADMDEFCGKIKAAKDAQNCEDFSVVARVEAFIAGWGIEEALKRAEAYRLAGADAILIHSALRSPNEILAFKKEWGNRHPVVIVPTKYYSTPTSVFKDHGFSVVIWANHLMRSSLTAMKETAKTIYQDQNLLNVEDKVVSVAEVFRIQGEDELSIAEKLYLPGSNETTKAVVLAASRGKELGDLTLHVPKAMVKIGSKPLLSHVGDSLREVGIKDISVVRGYKKDAVNLPGFTYFDNDEYDSASELYSLSRAVNAIEGKCIISYGDVLFKKYLVQELIDSSDDFTIVVDSNWQNSNNRTRNGDYVKCSEPSSKKSFYSKVKLVDIYDQANDGVHGEWMGMLKLSSRGAKIVREKILHLSKEMDSMKKLTLLDLMKRLLQDGHEIRVLYQSGHWLDIDSVDDVLVGSSF